MKNKFRLCAAVVMACAFFVCCEFPTVPDDDDVVIVPSDSTGYSDTLTRDIQMKPDSIDFVPVPMMSEELENKVQAGMKKARLRSVSGNYKIPVVVHVIYTGSPIDRSNIPDAQIYSAIESMNHDFAADAIATSMSVPTGIEFVLAKKDPQGNPTTGIVRVNGDVVPLYKDYGIKGSSGTGADEVAVKNLSKWNHQNYLNIWVVTEISNNNGGNGVQGFAYLPLTPSRDGVVVLHSVFGSVDKDRNGVQDPIIPGMTLKASQNLNKVTTHEVGHYLSLYHVFHGTGPYCYDETDCLTGGDKVCDTPVQNQGTGCVTPACNLAGSSKYVFPDNFMAYGTQTCLKKFTEGQKTRMVGTVLGVRKTLLTSPGLSAPQETEASLEVLVNGFTCFTSTPVQGRITNGGTNPITSITVNGKSILTPSIPAGSSAVVDLTLPIATTEFKKYEVTYTLTHTNGLVDPVTTNNVSVARTERVTGQAVRMDFVIDYYGSENSWTVTNAAGQIVWFRNGYPQGTSGAMFANRLYTDVSCLPSGTYTLTMMDSNDDAQAFAATQAGFKLWVGSTVAVRSGPCWCAPELTFAQLQAIPSASRPCKTIACKKATWTFTVS